MAAVESRDIGCMVICYGGHGWADTVREGNLFGGVVGGCNLQLAMPANPVQPPSPRSTCSQLAMPANPIETPRSTHSQLEHVSIEAVLARLESSLAWVEKLRVLSSLRLALTVPDDAASSVGSMFKVWNVGGLCRRLDACVT
eukprot:362744-Chlamydomonas_euryale.AAC.2